MDEQLAALLDGAAAGVGRIVVLTGAGISAESGIPTFRGEEGYWTVGSKVYQPQEMATHAMFARCPEVVWPWYLSRRSICRAAEPNSGHRAVVELERAFGGRFALVTQNVDGLHLRAGSSLERTWQIHGNIDFMRCSRECGSLTEVPDGVEDWTLLRCPACGAPARPHVLWFDECYDEARYRFESSLNAAADANLLLVVGTAGATNLPNQMAGLALQTGAAFVDVNPDDNVFAQAARRYPRGFAARAKSGDALPGIVRRLIEAR